MVFGRTSSVWLAAAAAGVVVGACGGATTSSLFDTGTFIASDSGAPGTQPGNGGDDASSPSPHPGGHDSGAPPTQTDASVPPADASTGVDSAPPPPPPSGVPCGQKSCTPGSNKVCCIDQSPNGNPPICESANQCTNSGGLAVPCSKAADCIAAGSPAGTVCCVTEDQSGVASNVACAPASQCTDPQTQTWMCDPSDPTTCPTGDICKQSTVTIPPYSICVKGP